MGLWRWIGGTRARSFGASKSGNVAMLWALCAAALIGLTGLTVDFTRAQSIRAQLQNAADGAVLVAERMSSQSLADRTAAARAFFDAEAGDLATGATFEVIEIDGGGHRVEVTYPMPLSLARIISNQDWTINVASEAISNPSPSYEVALILDTTGSMASNNKIADLREAANALVDEVVQDDQDPYYTKVAVVPYSMAVNVGSTYAVQARGAISPGKTITGATRANPVVVTSANHGFANGDIVYITGVNGMTQLNNKAFTVANKTANTFRLSGVNGTSYGNYTSGGTAYCTTTGCEYYRFTNDSNYTGSATAEHPSSSINIFRVSTCVTERTGGNAYTDAAPSTTLLGRNYPSSSNPCNAANIIVPLTSNTATLTARINALTAAGSTAGHTGIAWGWYMLSPNFGYMLPAESRPGAYDDEEVVKIAVLLTDGEYNSSYCNGVISRDSTSGSGSSYDHINCNAPNGHSFDQGEELCERMQQAGVIIYTVAFDFSNVPDPARAQSLLETCATDASHQKSAETGDELVETFRDIGTAISQLRISR